MTEFKRRFHKLIATFLFYAWPWALSLIVTFFFPKIATTFHLSLFLMPLLILLIWAPFITIDIVRRNKEIAREKQKLHARFDAEDKALYGENNKIN